MSALTEAQWEALTSGNGAPDRAEFEAYALELPDAPAADDPAVWGYLAATLERTLAAEVDP